MQNAHCATCCLHAWEWSVQVLGEELLCAAGACKACLICTWLTSLALDVSHEGVQVVANLNGNPAHLALLCLNRQKAFEVDLTGSTLTFQVCCLDLAVLMNELCCCHSISVRSACTCCAVSHQPRCKAAQP